MKLEKNQVKCGIPLWKTNEETVSRRREKSVCPVPLR